LSYPAVKSSPEHFNISSLIAGSVKFYIFYITICSALLKMNLCGASKKQGENNFPDYMTFIAVND